MSVVAVGFIPAAPLLIPALAGADTDRDAQLRACVRSVVADIAHATDAVPGATLLVVGTADEVSTYTGTWDFTRIGLPMRGTGQGTLPTSLGIGAWFLDACEYAGPREYVGVAERTPPSACAALGQSLAQGRDIGVLVVGDGSARHDEKAPGWLDPRAEGFDAAATAALASGDPGNVIALDADLARDLLAVGRAPWQVAAGAAQGGTWNAGVAFEAAPYGVGYIVATWLPHLDSNQEPLD